MTDTIVRTLSAPDAAAAAGAAATAVADTSREDRARWLEAVADALDAAAEDLVPIAVAESRLAEARLTGEVARTTGQLRLFAGVLRDAGYLEVIIDHAVPDATPPQPDLRRMLVPTGPVAVYSASNFPFAFSVAGGDTASALAAGNPVVVKAHSGHPELSRRTAAVVAEALAGAGAPEGTFGLIEGTQAGRDLIQHPAITSGAFTGSLHGGRALFDLASGRPAPIPFYAELGSINPVVVTAQAVHSRISCGMSTMPEEAWSEPTVTLTPSAISLPAACRRRNCRSRCAGSKTARRPSSDGLRRASIATSCGSSQPECTISIFSSSTPRCSSRSISASPPRAMLESCVE